MIKTDQRVHAINGIYLESESYVKHRLQDIKEIVYLLEQGHEPEFSKMDNYVILNNKTFNGFSREDIEKIIKGEYKYGLETITK